MPRSRLNRAKYNVIRDVTGGEWVHGEYQKGYTEEIIVSATIQPNYSGNNMRHLPEGDRTKQAIMIFSNEELFMAQSGVTNPKQADIIVYDNTLWEVGWAKPYRNTGTSLQHTESVAVRLDETTGERNARIKNCQGSGIN